MPPGRKIERQSFPLHMTGSMLVTNLGSVMKAIVYEAAIMFTIDKVTSARP